MAQECVQYYLLPSSTEIRGSYIQMQYPVLQWNCVFMLKLTMCDGMDGIIVL